MSRALAVFGFVLCLIALMQACEALIGYDPEKHVITIGRR